MEIFSGTVEASFKETKVRGFLQDLMQLCEKHNISIHPDADTEDTVVTFHSWETFSCLEACSEVASLYWPRIQTEIVIRRNHESIKLVEEQRKKKGEKTTEST